MAVAVQTTARRVHADRSPAGAAPEPGYAGFVTRTIAFAIDAALIDIAALAVGGLVALVFSIMPVSDDVLTVGVAVGGVAFVLWSIVYFVTFWTTTGETPGSRMMRIRVVRADGTRLRPRHALARLVGMVIGLPLLVGYVPILVSDRRRGLHDVMAGTVVVDSPPEPERGTR